MEKNVLLPIGSIVKLNGPEKKIMIIGRFQKCDADKYDYCACLYPEGFINAEKSIVFNHSHIEKVYFIGFQDTEEFDFNKKLQEMMAKK